mmetsp:Transcript_25065/g.64738  ORF Transcript_25065/g.64738 Transcript_25065/m.64738 type:complete len:213 (-) Transcript_25065:551-1189(-)
MRITASPASFTASRWMLSRKLAVRACRDVRLPLRHARSSMRLAAERGFTAAIPSEKTVDAEQQSSVSCPLAIPTCTGGTRRVAAKTTLIEMSSAVVCSSTCRTRGANSGRQNSSKSSRDRKAPFVTKSVFLMNGFLNACGQSYGPSTSRRGANPTIGAPLPRAAAAARRLRHSPCASAIRSHEKNRSSSTEKSASVGTRSSGRKRFESRLYL